MSASSGIRFVAIPSDRVSSFWPLAKPHLERAARSNGNLFSADDIEASIVEGWTVLWVALDGQSVIAAATTRVLQYPGRKALAIDWVGGSRMREWMDEAHRSFVETAKANECSHLEGYGVRAWGRILGDRGWKQAYITYRMEI